MNAAEKARILLVDGNNIIHAWDDLLELHRQRRGLAHTELCHRLTAYQDASGMRVVVVFDGRGQRVQDESARAGIQIFYTDSSHTADDIIERLTEKYAGQYDISVATDDRAEQDAVIALGGQSISAAALRNLLESTDRQFRSRWGL